MTCLISCSSKLLHHTFCVMLLLSVFLGGCTGLFRATPEAKLRAIAPVAEIASPQVVGSGPISWTIDMPAVFEDRLLRFELQDSTGRVAQVQESQRPRWDWDHEAPGEYRVRVIVSAANGEEIASRWSRPFRVVPPLNLSPLRAEVDGPLMAGNARVPWTISAQGGGENANTLLNSSILMAAVKECRLKGQDAGSGPQTLPGAIGYAQLSAMHAVTKRPAAGPNLFRSPRN